MDSQRKPFQFWFYPAKSLATHNATLSNSGSIASMEDWNGNILGHIGGLVGLMQFLG